MRQSRRCAGGGAVRSAVLIPLVLLFVTVATSEAAQQTDRRLSGPTQAPVGAERRFALVVGNDAYPAARLQNARNDARGVGAALEELGFRVTRLEDASREALANAIARFSGALQSSDVAMFYFAGHGVQIDNENFLIAVDYQGNSQEAVRLNAIRASEVRDLLQRKAQVSLIVLDACRNNPFTGTRGGDGGLASMQAVGSLIAFAAASGQTASDNAAGGNGLFTSELLTVLHVPGLAAQEVFRRVRQQVYEKSSRRQFPELADGLLGDFVFRPGPRPVATPDTDLPRREELAFWEAIRDSRETRVFDEYLRQYPSGRFKVAAEARLAELRRSTTPSSSAGGFGAGVNPTPPRGNPRLPSLRWARIPAGTFQMGCVPGDTECDADEKPRHPVTLSKAFDLMTTEATLGMFRAYATATSRVMPGQPEWNTNDAQPVVNVTWDDAGAFCAWVGGRLPTEAEWEYGARGGVDGWRYVWGNTQKPEVNGRPAANIADESAKRKHADWWTILSGYDDRYAETAPIGSFPSNRFGLYDMAGNAWEWVVDWYGGYPAGAVTNPRGPSSGELHVVRGGSWYDSAWFLRVSSRGNPPLGGFYLYGVRCARDVSP